MTVALITGSHGFVGSHLRPLLAGVGWTVVGIGRSDVNQRSDIGRVDDYERANDLFVDDPDWFLRVGGR